MEARFILSKKKVIEQYNILKKLGVKISYSYKTNKEVGKVLDNHSDSFFSIHLLEEIDEIEEKKKIWFFPQAWNDNEIKLILDKGVTNFVIDNEIDLNKLLNILNIDKYFEIKNLTILLRMKFQEHRITSGRYFNYGMPYKKINLLISELKDNKNIEKLGIHVHRKSQNASEWEIKQELEESLTKESLEHIDIINIGGGLPIKYRTYTSEILPYIFTKIKEVKDWFHKDIYIEPGRFIAGPAIKLETEIIQIREDTIIVNTSIYNGVLDSMITDIRLLVEGEIDDNSDIENQSHFKIKGNTPTRDDIFRHKVYLKNPKVGDKLTFLNAGAYNYTTDFCSLKKLKTVILENFNDTNINHSNNLDNKKIIIVPTNQGSLGKNIGCELAGEQILNGLNTLNLNTTTATIDNNNFLNTIKNLENIKDINEKIFIGGDHSITYPLFKNFTNLTKKSDNNEPGLIVFDAHPDCVNNFSPPTHEDFIRVLISEHIIKPENIFIIGLRNVDKIEKDFLEKMNIKNIYAKDFNENSLKDLLEFIKKFNNIYLSVDIDVLDPLEAPGTGYPESGGLKLKKLIKYLELLKKSGKIKCLDIVEINPLKDINNKTIIAGQEILKVFL